MGGWLTIALAAFAAIRFSSTKHTFLMIIAIIAVIGDYWTYRIMRHYSDRYGTPQAAPDGATALNMIFGIGGGILFLISIFLKAR